MQILKDVVVKSSTHTEAASCFTPRLSCSADTSTVGTDLNFFCKNANTKLEMLIGKLRDLSSVSFEIRSNLYILKIKIEMSFKKTLLRLPHFLQHANATT